MQHVKYCGSTFSRFKSALCTKEIVAVGHHCTPQGQLPDLKYINKISKWGSCKNILKQLVAQKDLKKALIASLMLQPLNYTTNSPVILTVDSLAIAVGFYLYQEDIDNPKRWYFAHFGSILFND